MAFRPPQGTLGELVRAAMEDVAMRKRERPGLVSEVARARLRPRGFLAALTDPERCGFALICEVKRASPSAGTLRAAADAPSLARAFVEGGTRCVSVLTEGRRFGGSLQDLRAVREAVDVPLLRKDFMVDPYMAFEAAEAGADCILLIAGALEPSRMEEIAAAARELGLDILIELANARDVPVIDAIDTPLVGVNARDLETLEVDAARFDRLAPSLRRPGRTLVAESGIRDAVDIRRVAEWGARAALVGESLMRSGDPVRAVRALVEAGA